MADKGVRGEEWISSLGEQEVFLLESTLNMVPRPRDYIIHKDHIEIYKPDSDAPVKRLYSRHELELFISSYTMGVVDGRQRRRRYE